MCLSFVKCINSRLKYTVVLTCQVIWFNLPRWIHFSNSQFIHQHGWIIFILIWSMYFFHICHVKAFNSACYNANSGWLALHTKYCSLFFRYLIIKWNRKLLLHGGNGLKNKNANKKHTGIKVSVPLQGDKNPCNQCCYLPSVKTFNSDNKNLNLMLAP